MPLELQNLIDLGLELGPWVLIILVLIWMLRDKDIRDKVQHKEKSIVFDGWLSKFWDNNEKMMKEFSGLVNKVADVTERVITSLENNTNSIEDTKRVIERVERLLDRQK